jgi:hypothetical protein
MMFLVGTGAFSELEIFSDLAIYEYETCKICGL